MCCGLMSELKDRVDAYSALVFVVILCHHELMMLEGGRNEKEGKVPAEKQPWLKTQDQKSGLSWPFGHMQLAHKSHNSQPETASREETR